MAALVAESSAKLPRPAFCRRDNTSFSQSSRNGLFEKYKQTNLNQLYCTVLHMLIETNYTNLDNFADENVITLVLNAVFNDDLQVSGIKIIIFS